MSRTSPGGAEQTELVRAHGAALHRLAAVLTADSWRATELTARTLADEGRRGAPGGPGDPSTADRLRADLVLRYLRSAPRRAEGLHTTDGDAGDVVRRLSPRARAASALRLVEHWSVEQTGRALRLSAHRVDTLVPRTPGLDLALLGLADQHALDGPDLDDALLRSIQDGPAAAAPGWRRWRGWAAAAALPVVLVSGYVVDGVRDDGSAPEEGPVPVAAGQDLTEAGWSIDDDGDLPRRAMGLSLRETVTVAKGRRTAPVSLPTPAGLGFASFAVLWCDMPPTQDDHLRTPAGTITVDGVEIAVPCAGRDGSPPVTQVVALPPDGVGILEVSGDMPGDGVAALGIYSELDQMDPPHPRGDRTDAPPVDDGAVALDVSAAQPSAFQHRRVVQALSVGRDSTIRVWAGRTGTVTVSVDGLAATDDGDMAALTAMFRQWSDEPDESGILPDPRDYGEWSTQQADVREGRWFVPAPGVTRSFDLPPGARPAAGERRTVVVEVTTEYVDEHLQVAVSDAQPAELDTSPVAAEEEDVDAPEFVLGHRRVAQWRLPSDAHMRELTPVPGTELPPGVLLTATQERAAEDWFGWGEGSATRGDAVVPLWLQPDRDAALLELRRGWIDPLAGTGPLSASVPAAPGFPPATVLAYAPVPYEDFDFAAAPVPSDAWPAGSEPPADSPFAGYRRVALIGPDDLEDGAVTRRVADDGSPRVGPGTTVGVRVTTEGRGRMRFLVDGVPADGLWATDGWWSSWTDEPVSSEVEVAFPGQIASDFELTVVVEDYQDFAVEVLTG